MSFGTYESSRSLGSPDTLYRFTYQNQVFAYTDSEEAITFEGVEYQPISIDRGAVTSAGTMDKATISIDVPHDSGIAELFRVYPPSDVVGVTIFQGHDADPEVQFLSVWAGRVISGSRKGVTATLTCEPVNTSMKRPGLRRRYQYGCPHALYGPQCRANRAAFTVVATVAVVSGSTLTLATGWNGSFAKANFGDGMLEFTDNGITDFRTILRVYPDTDRIIVSGKLATLAVGDTVKLSLGCNHLMTGCNVFGNIQNFGGQPWIPKKNPIGYVNQFY